MNNRKIPGEIMYEDFIDLRELAWCYKILEQRRRTKEVEPIARTILEQLEYRNILYGDDSSSESHQVIDGKSKEPIRFLIGNHNMFTYLGGARFTSHNFAQIFAHCLEEALECEKNKYFIDPQEVPF